jgi:alpha-1,2-mannosyltransferase
VPGTTGQGDRTRAEELTQTDATDSHSFQAVIHNLRYPMRYERPKDASASTRIAHWAICGLMTAATLWVGWRNRNPGVAEQLLVFGCLLLVMILASPVSHQHHYAMALPAVCAFWLKGLADRPGYAWPRPWVLVPLMIWLAATGIPMFPGLIFIQLREFGLGTFATVLLWGSGLWTLASIRRQAIVVPDASAGKTAIAA